MAEQFSMGRIYLCYGDAACRLCNIVMDTGNKYCRRSRDGGFHCRGFCAGSMLLFSFFDNI